MYALLLRTNPRLDFSMSLCRNYEVVGIQCSELKKPHFKNYSLECVKNSFLTDYETAF